MSFLRGNNCLRPGLTNRRPCGGTNGNGVEEKSQGTQDRLKARLNEAKVYDSMGLYDESRDVYVRILAEFPDIPEHSRARIQEEIDRIEAEIIGRDGEDVEPGLSPEALSFVRKDSLDAENLEDAFSRATTFVETGHYREALDEYRKLLEHGFPIDRILGNLIPCILRVHGPDHAVAQMETLCSETSLGKRERARIKFKLGVEMENLQRVDEAVSLYRSARMTIPEDLNMRSALDAKIAALSTDSPYAYLLNQGWITEDDVEKARTQADRTDASVEAVLMDVFNIGKEDLGRSLSLYYGFPFKTYDPNVMVPVELLSRLDRSTLALEGWVPLAVYAQEVEILMAAPDDASKKQRILSMINADSLNIAVGIREEIETYLERFYRVVEQAGESLARSESDKPTVESRKTRRKPRYAPSIPHFSYVEFSIEVKGGGMKDCRLDVLNSSENGIGLLLRKEDDDIAKMMTPGLLIRDMVFYATWTLIRADARVRHVTRLTNGPHKGHYLLGVESEEVIESSRAPE